MLQKKALTSAYRFWVSILEVSRRFPDSLSLDFQSSIFGFKFIHSRMTLSEKVDSEDKGPNDSITAHTAIKSAMKAKPRSKRVGIHHAPRAKAAFERQKPRISFQICKERYWKRMKDQTEARLVNRTEKSKVKLPNYSIGLTNEVPSVIGQSVAYSDVSRNGLTLPSVSRLEGHLNSCALLPVQMLSAVGPSSATHGPSLPVLESRREAPSAVKISPQASSLSSHSFVTRPDCFSSRPKNNLLTPENGGAMFPVSDWTEPIIQGMAEFLAKEEDEDADREVEEIMSNAKEMRREAVQGQRQPATEMSSRRNGDFLAPNAKINAYRFSLPNTSTHPQNQQPFGHCAYSNAASKEEGFDDYFELMNNYPVTQVYQNSAHRQSALRKEKAAYERYMGRHWFPGEEEAYMAFLKRVLPGTWQGSVESWRDFLARDYFTANCKAAMAY